MLIRPLDPVRDNDPDSLRFAERFGLRQHRHLFEARLFLADFDAGRFANVAADGQIVALAGDAWVGVAAVGYFAATNSMYNMFTGVEPAWRGKGIALALKLRAIACARRYGANYISTNNDSENVPMLAINRRLGYQPAPGFYRMIREPAFS